MDDKCYSGKKDTLFHLLMFSVQIYTDFSTEKLYHHGYGRMDGTGSVTLISTTCG